MRILNIYNENRQIYLFCRDDAGIQTVVPIHNFAPYYYNLDSRGKFITFDGKKATQVICRAPSDISKYRKDDSPESDVLFTKRYLIDRVPSIEKTPIKYFFIDIEIQTKDLPNYQYPNQPISCISVYNSLSKSIQTWYVEDCEEQSLEIQERWVIESFIEYMQEEKPDLWLSWNVDFDYNYLFARYTRIFDTTEGYNFAQRISSLTKARPGNSKDNILYPAGISILDYLGLFKKVYPREASYALDYIAQKKLGETAWTKTDFSILSSEIPEKNRNDVERMQRLEDKYKLISYYDEVRRMSKCLWEDLIWNSRVVDQLILSEAKLRKIILPRKPLKEDTPYTDDKEETFEGAYRRAEPGRYDNIWKVDLGSAYPMSIIDFCLDTSNIVNEINLNSLYPTTMVNNIGFNQNPDAIMPSVAKKMLITKAAMKKELKGLNPESQEAKDLQIKYDAIKAVVNSLFGVTGLKVFRLFDMRVASSITFLIRDLLHYVEDKSGLKIIYIDTDSLFIIAKEDPTIQLNVLVKQWAKEKYQKDNIEIEFDCEGYFDRLLIVAMCRYCGYLVTKTGIKKEIKGIEAKRKDSSKFMQEFQTELIERILNKEEKLQIDEFINEAKEKIKTVPIEDIAFPCKIQPNKEYKNVPIFVRALRYTQDIIDFKKNSGDLFYYIYVEPFGKEIKLGKRKVTKKGISEIKQIEIKSDKNVLAFDEDQKDHVKAVDWKKMEARNIDSKVETIYEALKWIKTLEHSDEEEN